MGGLGLNKCIEIVRRPHMKSYAHQSMRRGSRDTAVGVGMPGSVLPACTFRRAYVVQSPELINRVVSIYLVY